MLVHSFDKMAEERQALLLNKADEYLRTLD
jgi:hypothetical protein